VSDPLALLVCTCAQLPKRLIITCWIFTSLDFPSCHSDVLHITSAL